MIHSASRGFVLRMYPKQMRAVTGFIRELS
jgi:hypothetical protein